MDKPKKIRPAPEITPEIVREHGLTVEEFRRITDLIDRTPNMTELGIFSVMWSEHCSYKSSRPYLRKLPVEGPKVLQGPGENAGVIDIGDESSARKLRSNSTDAELKLWSALKNRQLGNFKFRRQAPIGKYIVDLVCRQKYLIVEVDGGQHIEASLADNDRTAWLQSHGYRVVRFWNDQVLKETATVLEEILRFLIQEKQR